MKRNTTTSLLLFVLIFTFFTPALQAKSKDKGQEAYNAGHYDQALKIWSKEIAKYERRNKASKCPYYTKAGDAAFLLGKTDVARKYLEAARYSISKNAETYALLSKIYRKIDNLSLEIDALEHYVKNYPDGKDINRIRKRLFVTYAESENWQQGLNLWPAVESLVKDSLQYETDLLKMYVGLDKESEAYKLSMHLMEKDNKNTEALLFLGKYYFWMAEKSYQAENKAYKANRTRSQYAHLLKAYKVITVQFKKSLIYFKTLYGVAPTSKTAAYLGDIYARLSDGKNAAYYHAMAKKLK